MENKDIILKASELFQKFGIKSVTMDDLARELAISKKTLYLYIKDKNDLVDKTVDLELFDRLDAIDSILKSELNAIEQQFRINDYINEMLKGFSHSSEYDLRKYYPSLHSKIRKIKSTRMYDFVVENLKKGKKEGLYRKELNEEVIAKLYVARIESLTENNVFTLNECINPEFFLEILIYHIRGIANEKGIGVLEDLLKKIKK